MAPDAARRALARRLFARALETPGGLKVQTIHAFCTQLLHQFPFEANVAARFTVLDEAEQTQLLEQLTLAVLLDGAKDPDGPLGRALAMAMTAAADQTFRDVVRDAIGRRDTIGALGHRRRRRRCRDCRAVARARHRSRRNPRQHRGGVLCRLCDRAARMARDRRRSGARRQDRRRAGAPVRLAGIAAAFRPGRDLPRHFLHRERPRAAQIHRHQVDQGCRPGRTAERGARPRLRAAGSPARGDLPRSLRRAAHRRLRRADALSATRKAAPRPARLRRSDRQDARASRAASMPPGCITSSISASIICLIDEAQDTSSKQWEIVRRLVAEFTAGAGARDVARARSSRSATRSSRSTRFRTPRRRNSPTMRRYFERAHAACGLDFVPGEFEHSFRSGESVLGRGRRGVRRTSRRSVTSDAGGFPPHIALARRAARPGRNLGAGRAGRTRGDRGLGCAVRSRSARPARG